LVVDDDEDVRRLHGRVLVDADYDCALAATCAEARGLLVDVVFSLTICELRIGGESGVDLVRGIMSDHPTTAVLIASAEDDPLIAEIALDSGACEYMVKPLTRNQLLIGVANALHQRRLEQQSDFQLRRLEQEVQKRSAEVRAAIEGMRITHDEAIHRLSKAVEVRDDQAGRHIERIGEFSALLGAHFGLPRDRAELLRVAAPMHDVGKLGIADRILLKPGNLTEEEREEMERHTEIGYRLLSSSKSELLEMAAVIALTHHERYDGSGYPCGLAGEEIPLEGRIVAVADVFDALISERIWRPAFPLREALGIMRQGRGTHFDPAVLDALLEDVDAVMLLAQHPTAKSVSSDLPAGLDPGLPAALPAPGVGHE
jgi:putative two-component system response regulator